MPVTDTTLDEMPIENQVVATLLEQSLGLHHKILLVEDETGDISFFRETASFVDVDSFPMVLGPFTNAADALSGINLL